MNLIAIDLNGTLLNSESVISPENRAALQIADEAGILVAICAGRATFDVKALLKFLDIPIIAAICGTVHD
ncbi:HAD hydrolase family protein, partial [Lysinibacillus sp. D4A1_S13]|uniref:HAD hydrolase family protein n=1 Tax=Lysinibacillus sp. D4A1_S13 TaxID=2941228 RepID=UPI0020BD47CF